MRKICLKVHRWLGLAFGGIISIICLTGAVIVFQDEIKETINADIRHVEDKGEGRYLTDEALIDDIRRHAVEGLTLKSLHIALEYFIAGLILMITIIGIPFGKIHFRLAKLALSPFGKELG